MTTPSASFLEIDINKLDAEWLKQPSLFFDYAVKEAHARLRLDDAKTALDIAKAEADKAVRSNPMAYGIAKVVNDAIASVITAMPKVQEAADEVRQAKYALDVLGAATKALEMRKSALERLVMLHGQNYFSAPTVPENLSKTSTIPTPSIKRPAGDMLVPL
jgi:hypothetical protein